MPTDSILHHRALNTGELAETPRSAVNPAETTSGVRVGINTHNQTLGKHRVRFSLDQPVAEVLRRGLSFPRCHIDGSFVNGLRIWCTEQDGMAPTLAKSGGWSFSVPVRRVRAREELIHTSEVDFMWERDDTGPVLLIPRLPDIMLPPAVVDKLPNSQVDMTTIMARADRRLQREVRELQALDDLKDEATGVPEPGEGVSSPQEPETTSQSVLQAAEPPSAPALDLKEALAMVNELVDQLGDSVVLSIDGHGHVRAKRRIVSFIDL